MTGNCFAQSEVSACLWWYAGVSVGPACLHPLTPMQISACLSAAMAQVPLNVLTHMHAFIQRPDLGCVAGLQGHLRRWVTYFCTCILMTVGATTPFLKNHWWE